MDTLTSDGLRYSIRAFRPGSDGTASGAVLFATPAAFGPAGMTADSLAAHAPHLAKGVDSKALGQCESRLVISFPELQRGCCHRRTELVDGPCMTATVSCRVMRDSDSVMHDMQTFHKPKRHGWASGTSEPRLEPYT